MNQPIEEKTDKIVTEGYRLGHLAIPSGTKWLTNSLENLLEQERKTYEAKKADYEFRSVGKWVDYHSRMGATIIVKNNLPVEARYENPIHSVIRAGLSLRNK